MYYNISFSDVKNSYLWSISFIEISSFLYIWIYHYTLELKCIKLLNNKNKRKYVIYCELCVLLYKNIEQYEDIDSNKHTLFLYKQK